MHSKPSIVRGRRAGFTLVELLIVITIIGILASLSFPALSAARESARKATCMGNLRSIGQATMTHLARNGFYPTGGWGPGWIGDPDQGYGPNQPGGWIYNLLPYLDNGPLHDLGASQGDTAKNTINAQRIKTALSFLHCPTRRRAKMYFLDGTTPNNFQGSWLQGAKSDYAMNCGSQWYNVALPKQSNWSPGSIQAGTTASTWTNLQTQLQSQLNGLNKKGRFLTPLDFNSYFTGISFLHSQVREAQVRDGKTFTLLAGEKWISFDQYEQPTAGYGDDGTFLQGFGQDLYRGTHYCDDYPRTDTYSNPQSSSQIFHTPRQDTQPYVTDTTDTATRTLSRGYDFGSAHSVSCNFVFCDGSVRPLMYGVDPKVYHCLGNRNDQVNIDLSQL